ncbi:hypothetical protein LARV_02238 [Longilinea arvoryzae]|uniref:Glycine zipper-like domain-containing protein n=1 Tax=Longilinea arvoryzae TaxID=360412 RepID=A0A0S7BH96_9CHLR|nr:hypothetical protein [Longilinea arvoryzae]GAP14468.1 hypothetical protein LARV_02238 [Longilinea arvoryzae]
MDNNDKEIANNEAQEQDTPREKATEGDDNYMVTGMCIGMCLGVAVGQLLFDNLATGMAVGMCLGLAIGSGIKKKK